MSQVRSQQFHLECSKRENPVARTELFFLQINLYLRLIVGVELKLHEVGQNPLQKSACKVNRLCLRDPLK